MIVVDASAMLEVLLVTPAALNAEQLLLASGESLHAPHFLDLEVVQVLRRYCAAGELDSARAQEALEDLEALGVTRYPHNLLAHHN